MPNWTMQTLTHTTTVRPKKEAHAHNKGLPKAGVKSFYDSLVLNQTLVFQMNGSAEMPRLRQAPKRYGQCRPTTVLPSTDRKTATPTLISAHLRATQKPTL